MTIPTAAPIAIVGISNPGGGSTVRFHTSSPHGLVAGQSSVAIGGCRDVSGVLLYGAATPALVVVTNAPVTYTSDSTHFDITSTFEAGYSYGGGVWAVGGEISHVPLTTLDAQLALRVTDKTGDNISGQYVMAEGVATSEPGASILTEVAGAEIIFESGIEPVLGDGDDWQLLPPRIRSIMISPSEVMNEYNVDAFGMFGFSGQLVTSGFNGGTCAVSDITTVDADPTSTIRDIWIPLTRIHDKSVLVAATLYFFPSPDFVSVGANAVPTTTPTLQIFRINPSTDVTLTSLAANGAVVFPAPTSMASYATNPAIGASGLVLPDVILIGQEVPVLAGAQLIDSVGNVFQVTSGTNTSDTVPFPVIAIAPAAPAPFMGANTDHAQGDTLTWIGTPPTGLTQTATVAAGGLAGGLNSGYAQKLIFTPDSDLAIIDQSSYIYLLRITDDNVGFSNGYGNLSTCYSGVRLDFANITNLGPQ